MEEENQQQISARRLGGRTEPPSYLASLALNEEVDPLVLVAQFVI